MERAIVDKKIVVLYHARCMDGFGGALAAWKKFGTNAEYFPLEHQKPLPGGLKGKTLYFIDIAPGNLKALIELRLANTRVTVIDHHAMVAEVARASEGGVFDNSHSGAILAWQYFHKGKKIPKLLLHIEDGDLWRFRLSRTKEILSFMSMEKLDFKRWDMVIKDFERKASASKHIRIGAAITKYTDKLIDELIERSAVPVRFCGFKTLAVNSPNFDSEIGNRLVKKMPPMGVVWHERKGETKVSLRSNGKVDVAKLAKRFGGGGHKAAAGFIIPAGKPLPWQRIEVNKEVRSLR